MRINGLRFLILALVLVPAALAAAATSPATHPATAPLAKATDFLRFVEQGAGGARLETADVAYRNSAGVTVHLVSAVHIGERDYFEGLNQSFRLRDAVLYEMVKPKDAPAPVAGERSDSTVSQIQQMLKQQLNLSFQLDVIDYTRPNFVHADLDAETFQKLQDERGESMPMLMVRQMLQQLMQPPGAGQNDQAMGPQLEDLIRAFTRPDGERQVKLLLARNLAQMEEGGMGLDAMEGTVILTERNRAAMKTLEQTLKDGKRDIAVFYGAAHMPDLSKRLEELGFAQIATDWRRAWDLNIRADQPSAVENLLLDVVRGMNELDQ